MSHQPVIPTDCPLFEAPICFRFALIRCIEKAAMDYLPTNWRGFAEYFMLSVDASIFTPAELIHHWVDKHQNKEQHTIGRVLEYAVAKHHRHLEEEFERVFSEHLVENYEQKINPADCFKLCEKCLEWQLNNSTDMKPCCVSLSHHPNGCITQHYYGTGSVVNHIVHQCEHQTNTESCSSDNNSVSTLHVNRTKVETASQTTPSVSPHQKEQPPTTTLPAYRRCISEGSTNIDQNKKVRFLNGTTAATHHHDKLHTFGHSMFNTIPHQLFRQHYRGKSKEVIRILFVLFILYQCLAAILMSICEEGGLRAVFKTSEKYNEIMNRFLKFSLRLMVRVIIPLCCSLQIPILASNPLIPETELTDKEAEKRMLVVHNFFTSEEETEQIRNCNGKIYELSEKMGKRKIECMWITMLHSFLQVSLLLYLGAFLVCEKNTLKGGVCDFLSASIVEIPFLQRDFHIIIALESFSIFIVLMVVGITIDCYSYENWIGIYAVVIGGKAEKLFHEIRHRWIIMDWFSCAGPLAIAAITVLSVSTGRPFTPYPAHSMPVGELANWYFWIMVLTMLNLLATSGYRIAKNASLCLYIASGVFLCTVKVDISHIPYGSIMVLLMTSSSALFLNFLYCLCLSHYYHSILSKHCGPRSLCVFVMCIVCMVTLLLSLVGIVCHEISYFGNSYVLW